LLDQRRARKARAPAAANPNQSPLRINENPPASTLAQVVANGKAQVDKAK
jgi:hypothetical protein